MQLRRPSTLAGSDAPDLDGSPFPVDSPSEPLMSGRLHPANTTPRLSTTPRLGTFADGAGRRNSPDLRPFTTPPSTLFGSIFRGGSRRESYGTPALPSHSSTRGRPLGPGIAAPTTPLLILRNLILRPFYILGRRGPLFPIVAILALTFFFFTFSTSIRSLRVKKSVQGAVRPYIPTAALNWRTVPDGKQQPIGLQVPGDGERRLDTIPASEAILPPPRRDGRMMLEEGKPHPIPALMARAKKDWAALKGRQSKNFAEAVREYKRRYERAPPKGFDKWFAFAKAHNVLLIDEFDLIDSDLKIFRAFTPHNFRVRALELADKMDTIWQIHITNGKVSRSGQLANHNRAAGVVSLIERFADELPDMMMVYSGHDGSRVALAAEEKIRLEALADAGTFEDPEVQPPFDPVERGPWPHHSMPAFCHQDSAVRAEGFDYGWPHPDSTGYEMPPLPEGAVGSILEDFKGHMDVCNSPQYRHFHCTTSWVYPHHPTPILPLLTPGVQPNFGDIHSIIIEQLELGDKHDPTWEERPFASLQWRGQTSGPLWEATTPWKTTQRARLHLLSHQETGERNISITDDDDNVRMVEVPNYRLNPLFLDVGMVGPAVQCTMEDGTCDKMYEVFQGFDKRMSFDRASLYKYVLDVDGNSWSGRFRRLMLSNAAVVKATIFPEFWTDWAIPWLHFIPMQVDYSDMWNIMAFFRGGVNGEGAHDALANEIAQAGKEWVKLCYRWADLEAYQYRLMLEYGRLWTDEKEPGSNDYSGDETIEPEWTGGVKL